MFLSAALEVQASFEFGKRTNLQSSTACNMVRYASSGVFRPREKTHQRTKGVGTAEAGKIKSRNRGFEVGGEVRRLLLVPKLKFQALTEERQILDIEPVARGGDYVISDYFLDPRVLIDDVQSDSSASSLSATDTSI
jgi:hypothetical protein